MRSSATKNSHSGTFTCYSHMNWLWEWKQATVQFNYHILCRMLYLVPYEYIKRKVDVRLLINH